MTKHHALHQWHHRDNIVQVLLPRFYENDLFADRDRDTFRTSDPELDMDDGDDLYAQALLKSDFLNWHDGGSNSSFASPSPSPSSSATTTASSSASSSVERLRMLVDHIGRSAPLYDALSSPPGMQWKGKGRMP